MYSCNASETVCKVSFLGTLCYMKRIEVENSNSSNFTNSN